ncbi:type II toxin-antitoxin system RelE/ParE family toxin [Ferribacterium limneticum]|uniref:type II toxin-antitoxin system RelE/ParE family toxin n=1 Tax=Ferribacterium limneticum TaxID=76259 RepID=UPI001CFBCFCD|nr:type II toxin-antitoxin system RelE/ParE family toxin [Ferribacterium limneticum]UCV18160.1 type II toxin-antitoxin system RelE/ParE family toxin [Ferribacterium limneticum]
MKTKPVIPREQANRDIDETLAYYLNEGSENAALGFIDTLEQAYAHISRHPATGSSHYAHELNLPGLRFWPLKRYPHLVFYVEHETHIDVWRVLNARRDIPAWLQENNAP